MNTWPGPKPQHRAPRRGPDQTLKDVLIIWVALIFIYKAVPFVPAGKTGSQEKRRIPILTLLTFYHVSGYLQL